MRKQSSFVRKPLTPLSMQNVIQRRQGLVSTLNEPLAMTTNPKAEGKHSLKILEPNNSLMNDLLLRFWDENPQRKVPDLLKRKKKATIKHLNLVQTLVKLNVWFVKFALIGLLAVWLENYANILLPHFSPKRKYNKSFSWTCHLSSKREKCIFPFQQNLQNIFYWCFLSACRWEK